MNMKSKFIFNKQVPKEIRDRMKVEERKCFLFRLLNDNYFKKDVLYVVSYLPENVKPFENNENFIGFPDMFPLARKGNEKPPASCGECDGVVTENPVNERFHVDKNVILDLIGENTSLESINAFYKIFDEYEQYERDCCQKYAKR